MNNKEHCLNNGILTDNAVNALTYINKIKIIAREVIFKFTPKQSQSSTLYV